ncbi:MAG: FAD-dependent oxidoreductase [Syntrophorhabdaceae bacterium]|nr:FAD-dependent oxidoreductase [Syntrophorhabdaceae bacterium]MDD4195276.1 FAD-dependent oxidoreductase [Syntrophorhabdaceae bacterium]
MNHETKLIDRERLAGGVAVFRFEKPEGFQFIAGQWCLLTVPAMGFEDDRGLRRPLSIASSPLEKHLLFATKLSESAFKRTMAEIEPGTAITLGSPMGALVLPEQTTTPLVFLAGGIGITLFRSMCRYAADAKTGHAITLFYSSRSPEETPFLEELLRIPQQNERLAVVVTMTRAPEDWTGLRGRLDAQTIKEHCPVWEKAVYYVAGPPVMADAMKQTLATMNVPADRIKVELFAGAQ